MSLKALHLVFVLASIVLCAAVAAICLSRYAADGETGNLVLGSASVAGGLLLIYYGKVILKKLQKISYL